MQPGTLVAVTSPENVNILEKINKILLSHYQLTPKYILLGLKQIT